MGVGCCRDFLGGPWTRCFCLGCCCVLMFLQRTLVFGNSIWWMQKAGRGLPPLPLVGVKHVMILTGFCPPRTDPEVSFSMASTSLSQCHCHSVVSVSGEEKSLPRVQAGISFVSAECSWLPSVPGSPRPPPAAPAWVWRLLSRTCFLQSEHGKCQPSISRSAPQDKAGCDLSVSSLKR